MQAGTPAIPGDEACAPRGEGVSVSRGYYMQAGTPAVPGKGVSVSGGYYMQARTPALPGDEACAPRGSLCDPGRDRVRSPVSPRPLSPVRWCSFCGASALTAAEVSAHHAVAPESLRP